MRVELGKWYIQVYKVGVIKIPLQADDRLFEVPMKKLVIFQLGYVPADSEHKKVWCLS